MFDDLEYGSDEWLDAMAVAYGGLAKTRMANPLRDEPGATDIKRGDMVNALLPLDESERGRYEGAKAMRKIGIVMHIDEKYAQVWFGKTDGGIYLIGVCEHWQISKSEGEV